MATYDELLLAAEDAGLNKKIRVACIIAAEAIRTEVVGATNHANRMLWAKAVFQNPPAEATRMGCAGAEQDCNVGYHRGRF